MQNKHHLIIINGISRFEFLSLFFKNLSFINLFRNTKKQLSLTLSNEENQIATTD